MDGSSFPLSLEGLYVREVRVIGEEVEVDIAPSAAHASCPVCGQTSGSVHSSYTRRLTDLPWSDRPVHLVVLARRFRCRRSDCPRRVFCERLPAVTAAYGRRTHRLVEALQALGLALGGRPAARLAVKLHTPTSRMTFLRLVRALPDPAARTPRVLGVDEWAFRRGRRYGTILVDLEQRQPVELLPEATASALTSWLQEHPGAEIISRDRAGAYADGARQGAPSATQVADRFHLLRNLGEVTERILRRHAPLLERIPAPGAFTLPTRLLRPDRRASRERTQRELEQRYEAIQRLRAQGMSIAATARALGLHRHTIEKYAHLEAAPERRYTGRRPSALTPYEPYLRERWRQGARKARGLWRELRARGYPGAYQNVARYVAALKKHLPDEANGLPVTTGLTARRAVGLVLTPPTQRTGAEQEALQQVKGVHPDIRQIVTLLERFAALIRRRKAPAAAQRLAQWVADARATDLPELTASVVKLEQDRRAVEAALVLPYSQGQTEGQINRLKTLKRMMYGRANFDLLRKRFLLAS
jgi:transposase